MSYCKKSTPQMLKNEPSIYAVQITKIVPKYTHLDVLQYFHAEVLIAPTAMNEHVGNLLGGPHHITNGC